MHFEKASRGGLEEARRRKRPRRAREEGRMAGGAERRREARARAAAAAARCAQIPVLGSGLHVPRAPRPGWAQVRRAELRLA